MFDRNTSTLALVDPELWTAVQNENRRQEDHIELIASENYTSPAVMQAQGSQLTNKYAEGYPGKRYYGGCEYVDVVEQLAIDRLKTLFGAEFANVQPNSGSQANQGVFFALLHQFGAVQAALLKAVQSELQLMRLAMCFVRLCAH